MSVTASRELVDQLCAVHAVPLLVLHDFDKSGFSIVGTLQRSTRRYRFGHGHAANVIDLGLRLEDIEGLETEDVVHQSDPASNLRENGATAEEIAFLRTRRVELNAFASDEFIEWIEGKLQQHGIAKVVPDRDTLAEAYRRMRRQALVQERINEALAELDDDEEDAEPTPIPDNLIGRIKERLSDDPALRWDAVLREIAEGDHEEAAP
jgi:hypothetical protein